MGAGSRGTDAPGRANFMDIHAVASPGLLLSRAPHLVDVLLWPSQTSQEFHLWTALCSEVWCALGACGSRVNAPSSATCTHSCPASAWLPSTGLAAQHVRVPGACGTLGALKGLLFLGTWAQIGGDGCMKSNNAGDSGEGFRRARRPCLQASLFFLGYGILCHTVTK